MPKKNEEPAERETADEEAFAGDRENRSPAPNDDDRATRSWDDLQEGAWSDFAFIAGFTSGGMPYGSTWEAMEAIERQQELARAVAQRRRERSPRRLAVDLAVLEATFRGGWCWDEIRSYLDTETGAVIELDDLAERSGEEADDEQAALRERIHSDRERYLELDTSISLLPTRDDAQQFIREVEDSGLRRRLSQVLAARRKPWRRFREVLASNAGELDRWRRLEWRVRRERLAEHLRDLGIEAVFDDPAEPTR